MMTTTPTAYEQLTEPVYKVLDDFMLNCSDDPETREAMASAMTVSYWQMAARGLTAQLPSMILVNAGGAEDPVLDAIRKLCNYQKDERTDIRGSGRFAGGTPAQAPAAMLFAVRSLQQHRKDFPVSPPLSDWESYFHDARVTGYGKGDIRPYAGAFDPKLGLVTDPRNSITLLLDDKQDWEAFRHDLSGEPQKIREPSGIGRGLDFTAKSMALSGSLDADDFDEKLVDAALELGHPLFFLPHTSSAPVKFRNYPGMSYFALHLKTPGLIPRNYPLMPEDKWCRYYQKWIWKRLLLMPVNYRFCILEAIHKLQSVCETLALYTGPASGDPVPGVAELANNLFNSLLRSMALSLAFLAWHGHGIEPGCSVNTTRKVLKLLREDGGSMKLRDLHRATGFGSAAKRDEVLARLENEGLVTLDDNLVSANDMHEFIANIREQLPMADRG
ncbi:hypothetical protein NT6N_03920 [Oceaniferula spumae]|uniref:Uncharacterized protein n=1 Tax=Oceaniferula spumae TaxID=2979115 RepID=A0AAT9FHA6_9BACT